MRADLFVCSGVLLLGLMTACHADPSSSDAGPGSDSGVIRDGGSPDAGSGGDGGIVTETACDVAAQTGCAAGAVCLRGLLGDGGVGNACFPGECDAVKQTCPAGSRCAYVLRDNVTARRCVPTSTGTVNEGGACQSTATAGGDFYDTCAPGLSCTDRSTSGNTTFSCQRLCYSAAQCSGSTDCIDALRFEGSNERPRVCGTPGASCDVLASNCPSPRGCYPSSGRGVCVSAGSVSAGQACEYANDCQPGSACVSTGAGRVCRALCRSPSGSPSCTGGLRCQALQDYAGVGVCVP